MTTLVIADDHEVVRQGLRSVLRRHNDLSVVAEAADGIEALRLVEQHKPDVLLLDLSLPAVAGLEVARELPGISPRTRILVFSMHATEAHVAHALRAGALGYLPKDSHAEELVAAIRNVAAGRRHISPLFSEAAIAEYLQSDEAKPLDLYDTLTTRERQILQLSAEGRTAAEIGELLFISPRTVETHRANLTRKLGLRTQTDLVLFAVRRGILPR